MAYNETFEQISFATAGFEKGEYEQCTFKGCDLSGADLSSAVFAECTFIDCNLGLAKVVKTAFRDVSFVNCKLLGIRFETCSEFLFAVKLEGCIVNLASFYKMKMKATTFRNCSMHETDLGGTDLTGAIFDQCDLAGAKFEQTNLEKADLRTAYNYTINPSDNRIKKARFSASGVAGLLAGFDIIIEQ